MTYYQIENKLYYLNLDNLFALVSETPNNEKIVNTTISQTYIGEDGSDASKEIVEAKSNLNDTMNNIRYDTVKGLIACLLGTNFSYDGTPISVMKLSDLTFPQGLCFNTLIEYKILKEVGDNE